MSATQKEADFFNRADGGAEMDGGKDACLKQFDLDRDGKLAVDEFGGLCRALFRNASGEPCPLASRKLAEIFCVFDKNQDGFIDRDEFELCWSSWITVIVHPVTALIIVDVQNDFIGGSLAVCNCPAGHRGEEVVPVVNKLLETVKFDVVAYSLDWHPSDHISFVTNVANFPMHPSSPITAANAKTYDKVTFDGDQKRVQVLWPPHCVQQSWGAELHTDLKVVDDAVWIKKGCNREIDSYSAFFDNNKLSETGLRSELRRRSVTDVYVCGLAYDVCVGATAAHALEEGLRTVIVDDACRGVNADDIDAVKTSLQRQHGVIVHSSQVAAMAQGRHRPFEMAFKLAMDLRDK